MKFLGFVPRIKWETEDFSAVCSALQVKQEMLGLLCEASNGKLKKMCRVSVTEQETLNASALCRESNGKQGTSVLCVVRYKGKRQCLDTCVMMQMANRKKLDCVSFVTSGKEEYLYLPGE
jgi:hypothetical protein